MKRMKQSIPILAIAAISPITLAGVISQNVTFESGFNGTNINFEQFDTMGGTRELTGLSLSYNQNISLDMTIQSNGYTALSEGDWSADVGYLSLHQFGLADDGGTQPRGGDGNPGPPFIGPGAIFDIISGDLGISDGYNNGGIDTMHANISDSYTFNANYDGSDEFSQRMFEAFTGPGTLETFYGGFIELFFQWHNDPNWVVDPNNPPDGPFDGPFIDPYYGIFVNFDALDHYGDITVTYEYETVPTPAGTALLAFAGLATTRRRR